MSNTNNNNHNGKKLIGKKEKFFIILLVILISAIFQPWKIIFQDHEQAKKMSDINTKFDPLNSHKIETIRFTDPQIENLDCYISSLKVGGLKGSVGVAEDSSEMSLSCVLRGNKGILKEKLESESVVYKESRSLAFKTLKVVRNFDKEKQVVYYVAYSDKILSGDNNNATSAVWLGDYTISNPKSNQNLNP